ncbi:MAG: BMP family protein [Clostridiaceae bacterium]
MKKRLLAALVATVVCASVFVGCGKSTETSTTKKSEKTKVGMVTDSGTIDDKSFNQGTWEGIKKYESDKSTIDTKYLKPSGEQETDYTNAINDLVDSGYKLVVTPGFKFETAVNKAADDHKDTTFVLIDGSTHIKDSFDFVKHDNVVCVFFNEHEAGFLAGVSSALSTKTGKLGFIGGMKIPPVERFGVGYKAGVAYANKNLGTKAEVVDYIFEGSFNNLAGGKTLAAGMYNKGIDIIFAAAGGTGTGAFNEAKDRAEKGENVFVVGVDVDQYEAGKISNGKSVTLTSAMKRIDVAAYDYIDAKLNDKFPGGEIITLSLKENGVGLPEKNPNLSDDTVKKVDEAKKAIVDGKVTVPKTEEELKDFLK